MKKSEVIRYFGSQTATAKALKLKQPSVQRWGEKLPPLRQLQIEVLTGGALRAGRECDRFRIGLARKR